MSKDDSKKFNFDDYTNQDIDKEKIYIEIPQQEQPIDYENRIPNGYTPMGHINLIGRTFSGFSARKNPLWVNIGGCVIVGMFALPIIISVVDSIIPTQQKSSEQSNQIQEETIHNNNDYTDNAIVDLNKAIELAPNDAEAYNNRSFFYFERGKYDQAIADYNKAIELAPNDAVYYYNRGVAYAEKGEYDKAIIDYNKAIELDPNNTDTYINRGFIYGEKGKYDQAMANFNKAIELDPNYSMAYNNRGYMYQKKGEYDKAIPDYNKAIELDPNNENAIGNKEKLLYFLQKK